MVIAYIGKVIEINAIQGADRIESLTVICGKGGKWQGITEKGLFKIDDLCEVYLQDALLPKTERFAFMGKHNYRVKMRRFKGVPSECLIMPNTYIARKTGVLNLETGEQVEMPYRNMEVGDIIEGIEKYEKPIPEHLSGEVYGSFPTHIIPKTDEPNFQTAPQMIEELKNKPCYITQKYDGSSVTFYKYQGHFGVCSRNLELKETESNILWKLAKKYKIEERMPDNFAIQAEAVGPKIQNNPLGFKEQDIRVFNVWDIINRKYLDAQGFLDFVKEREFPFVKILVWDEPFKYESDEQLRKEAEGNYQNGKPREGIVIRPMQEMLVRGERLSFKVINLDYIEK